ncbi:MAG: PTS sugar transporter subunit IIA [Phycisphaerales bacterium]|nr:PTS sugar transporter subunit IIA [Phycisphaerales bacterium]
MKTLLDILTPECIKVPLEATDKRAAIEELVDVLDDAGRISDPDAIKHAIWEREQAKSTGIGLGLAIPHGKSPTEAGIAMSIGRPAEPIEFDSIDHEPVRFVVLISSPPDKTSDHIQTLARISRLMTDNAFREAAYTVSTAEELYELIREKEEALVAGK